MSETTFRPGAVVTYTPDQTRHDPRWCREGMAIADNAGHLYDTYWHSGDNHRLRGDEVTSARVLFHLDDADEIDQWKRTSPTWETYAEADRWRVTSQHGLQSRWFVRKGAKPDLDMQIANARRAVEEAQYDLDSARRTLEYREERLDELLDLEPASSAVPVARGAENPGGTP